MLDGLKEYVKPKTFSILAYVCSIVQVFYCSIFIPLIVHLKDGELEKFTCYVAPESTLIYKTQVDKACYSRYQEKYNSPLPFYLFVIISGLFPFIVAPIYSLSVHSRVKQVNSSTNTAQTERETERQRQITGSSYVFYFYFIHLAIRALLGILFFILQYAVFFPNGFDFEFSCSLKRTQFSFNTARNDVTFNGTTVACENPSTRDKNILWVIVLIFNIGFASIMVFEMIRLSLLFPKCDYTQFIVGYLLQNQYSPVAIELAAVDINLQESEESVGANLQECIYFYKKQVLRSPRSTDIISAPKTTLDDLYVHLIVHSERAPHKFAEKMQRHEIYDVYMQVPRNSISLKDVKDLFYPNEDTKGKSPKTILAVGRPGIGKTFLTEKIMHDWAGTANECYDDKIAFHFKIRWFNENERNNINLKAFLRYGTGLSDEKFDRIYEYITKHSEKAILVFDGLDEFNGNSECLTGHFPPPGDRDSSMSWTSLFINLMRRHHEFLPEATIVATSRPTANEFYSRFSFDRTVEIIGFTPDKIEEYIQKLCNNNGRSDIKLKIWKYIISNADILNLCYIPVNCWIVSTILFKCFEDPESEYVPVPSTLTELYQEAVTHLDKHHFREFDGKMSAEVRKKLQLLAFEGIESHQLVFSDEIFDEQMRKSGLLNKLSNPYSEAQQQFCFIHLTIQEFLAAKYVTESFTPEKINEFITSHFKSGKWHLVLQFIAGLLGKKITKHFQRHYSGCVPAFAKCLIVKNGKLELTDDISMRVIKCLGEIHDENLIGKCTEATTINEVVDLSYKLVYDSTSSLPLPLTLSDWDAVALVCKHMKNLMSLELRVFNVDFERIVDVTKLLEQRCIKKVKIQGSRNSVVINVRGAVSALLKSTCVVEHEHSEVTELHFGWLYISDDTWWDFLNFFKVGRAHSLKKLVLMGGCLFRPGASMPLFKVLTNEHCPMLTYLHLSGNSFSHEEVEALCGQRLLNLAQLYLQECFLQEECIPPICELLTDERCNLTHLSLEYNRDYRSLGSLGMLKILASTL
jgi:GTPase SAR1 family protein